jgi:hydroxymethylglutaryl-CoA lyase
LRYPPKVTIVEVGPRDGLQNEGAPIATDDKVTFVNLLSEAGLQAIEVSAFVSPKRVPQMADAADVFARITRKPGTRYSALVPNLAGLTRAHEAGVTEVAVFAAASEGFSRSNINQSIEESLDGYRAVCARAAELGIRVRGYVSTAFGCPYSGAVDPNQVVDVALRLLALGVEEVCFGDTIGVGVPPQVRDLTARAVDAGIPLDRIAFHFHDTRGTALANVAAAMSSGIRCFDASTGGTGGCPYAPGAAGNLATEDLVYLLDAIGLNHGVSLEAVLEAARFIADALGRPLATKVGQAGGWDPRTGRPTGRV